jgi:hypothetical protein
MKAKAEKLVGEIAAWFVFVQGAGPLFFASGRPPLRWLICVILAVLSGMYAIALRIRNLVIAKVFYYLWLAIWFIPTSFMAIVFGFGRVLKELNKHGFAECLRGFLLTLILLVFNVIILRLYWVGLKGLEKMKKEEVG